MITAKEIAVLEKMDLVFDEIDDLTRIALDAHDKLKKHHVAFIIARVAINSYKYGVMQAKREERARRKNSKKQ